VKEENRTPASPRPSRFARSPGGHQRQALPEDTAQGFRPTTVQRFIPGTPPSTPHRGEGAELDAVPRFHQAIVHAAVIHRLDRY